MNRITLPSGLRTYLRRGTYWAIAILLAGTTAWLSIQVRWTTLWTALSQVHPLLLTLALATVLVTTVAKAARWRVLLRPCNAFPGGIRVLRVLFINQMANIFLPARLGDVARAALFGPQAAGGFPAVLGTIVVEKAFDGVMGLLVLLGLALWIPVPTWLHAPILGLATLTGILLALLGLAATQHTWALRIYHGLVFWLPAGAQTRARCLLANFRQGLALFRQPANALLALGWSGIVWSLAALTNMVTLAALDIKAPGWSTWLVLLTGYVANFLPAIPAQIGIFEYACVLSLTAVGVSQEQALAFGLTLHLLVHGPPALLGPISMAIEGLSWDKVKRAQKGSLEQNGVRP
jgi:uncharacterized protein (TIRG00374 family)